MGACQVMADIKGFDSPEDYEDYIKKLTDIFAKSGIIYPIPDKGATINSAFYPESKMTTQFVISCPPNACGHCMTICNPDVSLMVQFSCALSPGHRGYHRNDADNGPANTSGKPWVMEWE